MENSIKNLIASYTDALYPFIYINHFNFHAADEMIGEIADGYDHPTFIVLKNVSRQLDRPEIVSLLLKHITERNLHNGEYSATVFIVSNRLTIHEEPEDFITVFDVPLPTMEEIADIVSDYVSEAVELAGKTVGSIRSSRPFFARTQYQSAFSVSRSKKAGKQNCFTF